MNIFISLKKDKQTRKKLLLTMLILFLVQIGYQVPLPGINSTFLQSYLANFGATGNFFNIMTGNSLSRLSLFALSITPYITASIILQLLTVAFPFLEAIQKDGAVGQRKMEKLTYALGIIMAFLQAIGLSIGFGKQGLFTSYTWYMVLYATIIWTLGAAFLMWIGNQITHKLIGNGISLMLLFNMLGSLPTDAKIIYNVFASNKPILTQILVIIIAIIIAILVFMYVVLLNNAEKRIPIASSHKISAGMINTHSNFMPLKLAMGGVMPIIFSSSIMSLPVIIGQFFKLDANATASKIISCFNQQYWFNTNRFYCSIGVLIYIGLTFLFASFYMNISFNPKEIADTLRKNGSTIPGIRPGEPTAQYLEREAKSMLVLGTTMLLTIALLPSMLSGFFNLGSLSFGGTTIIIIVGVIIETVNKIEAQTSSVKYNRLTRRKN